MISSTTHTCCPRKQSYNDPRYGCFLTGSLLNVRISPCTRCPFACNSFNVPSTRPISPLINSNRFDTSSFASIKSCGNSTGPCALNTFASSGRVENSFTPLVQRTGLYGGGRGEPFRRKCFLGVGPRAFADFRRLWRVLLLV
jgi:hypothetical protein